MCDKLETIEFTKNALLAGALERKIRIEFKDLEEKSPGELRRITKAIMFNIRYGMSESDFRSSLIETSRVSGGK